LAHDAASRFVSVDGPWADDTVSYEYNALAARSALARLERSQAALDICEYGMIGCKMVLPTKYRVQPVYVGDLADIAIEQSMSPTGTSVDAIGPETFTFEELVKLIADKLRKNPIVMKVPPSLGICCGQILGLFLRDVLLTRNELKGLMDELLTSRQLPNAPTRFSDWLEKNKSTVGGCYSSEVARHFRWSASAKAIR
jgi:hypothetical protein